MRFMTGRGGARSATDIAPSPPGTSSLASARLQRLGAYFVSHEELLREMRENIEHELSPVAELLLRQPGTVDQLLGNLEEWLRPLKEHAAGEEQNLGALEEWIGSSKFLARTFSDYISDERRRIDEAGQQIDAQRAPFVRYADDQRATVESALSRFDEEIAALERNLREQRDVLIRMLEAMRSDTFVQAREYLAEREATLAGLATQGEADPSEIVATVKGLRAGIERAAERSEHLRVVLEAADRADQRLADGATRPRPQVFPRGVQPADEAPTVKQESAAQGANAA